MRASVAADDVPVGPCDESSVFLSARARRATGARADAAPPSGGVMKDKTKKKTKKTRAKGTPRDAPRAGADLGGAWDMGVPLDAADGALAMRTALSATTDEARLILGLDPFTFRHLTRYPPAPTETMAQIGLAPGDLDGPIRAWINRDFREPKLKDDLLSGDIRGTTKWSALLAMI